MKDLCDIPAYALSIQTVTAAKIVVWYGDNCNVRKLDKTGGIAPVLKVKLVLAAGGDDRQFLSFGILEVGIGVSIGRDEYLDLSIAKIPL